jgi:hypothetical protein
MQLVKEMDWTMDKYKRVFEIIQKNIPDIGIGCRTCFASNERI